MREYHLRQSPKTKILNFFRKPLTFPIFEKLLVKQTVEKSSNFFKKLVPPDYLYKQGSFRNVTRNGLNLKLDISHVVDHYIYFGYKDADYDSIIESISKSKTIFDIGANIGTTSLFFASLNPKAKIYSFEPHPSSFKRAAENVSLNSFTNIELLNTGLGEKKEIVKLYEVNEHNPGMNRIIAEEKNLPFKTIEIDSLDNICKVKGITQVDLIKLDVEGFEYSVLKGAKEIILNSKPLLFIELDDNYLKENNSTSKEVITLLISYGYSNIYRADNLAPINSETSFSNCHYNIIAK
jgi:FkbM family methyltransferase